MKKWTVCVAALVLMLGFVPELRADDGDVEVDWFGSLRIRPEYNESLSDAFGGYDDKVGYISYRANLGAKVELDRDITIVLDGQVQGRWGENEDYMSLGGPSGCCGEGKFNFFQAYAEAKNMFGSPFSLRVGRQTLIFADEWLMGDLDHFNGFYHDAFRGTFEHNLGQVDLFWSKVNDDDIPEFFPEDEDMGGDWDLYGAWTAWDLPGDQTVDAAVIYSLDHITAMGYEGYWPFRDKRWTYTINYEYGAETGPFFVGNIAMQWGRTIDFEGDTKRDIDADALDLQGGWAFDRGGGHYRIYLRYAHFSGDDTDTEDCETFDPLWQDFHGRYGFLDFWNGFWGFVPFIGGDQGFQTHQFGFEANLANGIMIKGIAQRMKKTTTISDVLGSRALGQEYGFTFGYKYGENASIELGLAQLYPGTAFTYIEPLRGQSTVRRFYVNTVVKF
jgi:hypothetical protein